MIDGVAFRDRRTRSTGLGSNNDMSASGSSRVAAGVTGFLAAAAVEVVLVGEVLVAVVLEGVGARLDAAVVVGVDAGFAPVFAVEVVLVPVDFVPLVALDFDVAVAPLRPRSFLTLFVTELTSLVIPPISLVIELPISLASAIVFSNSPVSSADIRRKSRTILPA